jgi:hypothetical protein
MRSNGAQVGDDWMRRDMHTLLCKNKNNAGTVWTHKMAKQTLSLPHAVVFFFENVLYMQLVKNILLNNTLKANSFYH